jgi:hypothetical protein
MPESLSSYAPGKADVLVVRTHSRAANVGAVQIEIGIAEHG